jgi:hypothetical protein
MFCDKKLIRDSMYCEGSVRIPNDLNKGLHDVLVFEPVVILTIFFWSWKTLLLSVEVPQKIMPYSNFKWKEAK